MKINRSKILALLLAVVFFTLLSQGCRTMPPIRTADSVDLDAFMGDWYVVANIPTFLERDAWNALERYELNDDGVIETTFTFRKGGPEGPLKTYRPKGFVKDAESNAVWGMQFIWPIKAEYIIMFVDEAYTHTMVGRRKRDYLWIMARDPEIDDETVNRMIDLAVEEGYDRDKIQRVPHEGRDSP
ncbi:MAG: lipocalin family protein [Verrucomicrobia bacterium]|nr:lipocalin family protein [Verrucomicrobiota bacterium]